jgi:superfamily I DNA and/or RNA helicase
MQGVSFPFVVLDEGSQCSEPESLIPLVKGCQQLVLVGDHCQLPPVCQSEEAGRAGLAVSLFERLIKAGVPSCMLQVCVQGHDAVELCSAVVQRPATCHVCHMPHATCQCTPP